MDKETLSNYGWIVICVLVLAVMLALATPFGNFIADGFKAAFLGFGQTNNSMLDTMFDATGTPPSLEYLQKKYQFEYYSTVNLAVTDVNNGTVGASADIVKENKADAVAGIYTDENGGVNVVLLKDHIEETFITITSDMTINLGGHTITTNNQITCFYVTSGDVTIDGRLLGSTVQTINTNGTPAMPIYAQTNGNFAINGGTYIADAVESTNSCVVVDTAKSAAISNATIIAKATTNKTHGIQIQPGCASATISNCDFTTTVTGGESIGIANWSYDTEVINCNIKSTATDGRASTIENYDGYTLTVSNCDVKATTTDGRSYGALNGSGTLTINDCNIRAYSNYTYSDGDGYYGSISVGVNNYGTMTLNNCYARGTHSGVESTGTLYVNGGTYEGYGHGGFYFCGEGSGNTSYVQDATIRQCAMPDGYTATATCNGAGFYIGGATGNDNITVYMDNCDIYGSVQPIVLRGSEGEQNNSLYISNSRINTDRNIRIDNDTHKLYIGVGNNFTADNTGRPSAVITTNETYTQN